MRHFILFLLTLFLVSCADTPYKGEKVSVTKSNCDCPKIKTEKEDLAKFAVDIEEIMLLRSFILTFCLSI
jgi:hypothetical protein